MRALLEARFWIACIATFALLTGTGLGLARLLVEPVPRFHRNIFLEFPLPPDWSCDREGTETVCRPAQGEAQNAIIIFTAKYRGGIDTYAGYLDHLRTPRTVETNGRRWLSRPIYARESTIAGRVWIDGRQAESEIEHYETRYLATTTSYLAVLVTYAVHQEALAAREPALEAAVAGLTIFEPDDAGNRSPDRSMAGDRGGAP